VYDIMVCDIPSQLCSVSTSHLEGQGRGTRIVFEDSLKEVNSCVNNKTRTTIIITRRTAASMFIPPRTVKHLSQPGE